MAGAQRLLRFFEKSVAHLATVDVDTCFHRLRVGLNGSVWNQCVLVMSRRDVSGQLVEDGECIYQCLGALPTGYSWSLYFAQSVIEHALHEVEGTQDGCTQPCVLDISNPG